jgi:hypothetical protein
LGQNLDIEAVGEKKLPHNAVIQTQRLETPQSAHIDGRPTNTLS